MITQEILKEFLYYNKETGVFTRIKSTSSRAQAGDIAGYKNTIGYIVIRLVGKRYYAHRLAWLYIHGKFPEKYTDHINGIKDDNRIENLRDCTNSENQCNRSMQTNNTSGFKGVNRSNNKWRAQTNVNGKQKHIGLFNTPEEASQAYQSFVKQNHGEFYHG